MVGRRRSGADGANELFPSSDWRYLLPEPSPATVALADRGPRPALPDGFEARVLPAGACGADLAVGGVADRAALEHLAGRLRPGGIVYLELPWPRPRPADRLARRLVAAGFVEPRLYSLSPSRDRWSPSWWIPVGDPAGARFVARMGILDVGGRGSALHRARGGLTRLLSAVPVLMAGHPWLIQPNRRQRLCAVAIKPPLPGRADPGLLPPEGEGGRDGGRVVMRVGGSSTDQAMVFGLDRVGRPRLVVKAPTRPEEVAASSREAARLAALTDRADPMPGVPRPVELPPQPAIRAWGQSFACGRPLTAVADPGSLERHGSAMTEWLIGLAGRTASGDGAGRSLLGLCEEAVDELAGLWAVLPDGPALRDGALARLRGITAATLVCHHRDLGPWNVVVGDDGSLSVIDWADAVPAGPPLCDLHHFLTHLVLSGHDAYRPERWRVLVGPVADPRTEVGALVDQHLRHYADALGIDDASRTGLRVATWLLDLLRRPAGERVDSIYLGLLRAELGSVGAGSGSGNPAPVGGGRRSARLVSRSAGGGPSPSRPSRLRRWVR